MEGVGGNGHEARGEEEEEEQQHLPPPPLPFDTLPPISKEEERATHFSLLFPPFGARPSVQTDDAGGRKRTQKGKSENGKKGPFSNAFEYVQSTEEKTLMFVPLHPLSVVIVGTMHAYSRKGGPSSSSHGLTGRCLQRKEAIAVRERGEEIEPLLGLVVSLSLSFLLHKREKIQ